MDASVARRTAGAHLGLIDSARLIGGHCLVEHGLFELTGRWSSEAAGGADPTGIAGFFATQSVIHGWRLAEWQRRSPRSVPASDATGPPGGWTRALQLADAARTPDARLACWAQVLGLHLAARYRRHLSLCTPSADAGVIRWLGIAQNDILGAVVDGAALLTGSVATAEPDTDAMTSPAALAEAVAACTVPLVELGS